MIAEIIAALTSATAIANGIGLARTVATVRKGALDLESERERSRSAEIQLAAEREKVLAAAHQEHAAASADSTARHQAAGEENRLAAVVVKQIRDDVEALRKDLHSERTDRQRLDRELSGERDERRKERDAHVQAIAELTAANAGLRGEVERLREAHGVASARAERAEERGDKLETLVTELRERLTEAGLQVSPQRFSVTPDEVKK